MVKNKRYLVVDAGNTRIKVAVYNNDNLAEIHLFASDELTQLKSFLIDNRFHEAILSSVRSQKETKWMLQLMQGAKLFKTLPNYPIGLNYETPETLGADRLANAIAAFTKAKGNALVVDIGTCIKFDFVSEDGIYQGGSISPGIQMRYKAMNQFTAGLPMVNNLEQPKLIGKSTVECMHTGVMLGVEAEINAFIQDYQAKYEGLTIFITGGDAQYFDFASKNNTFVDENLTLTGLFITIQAHVH
jgi:type III pantothenate kinase